MAYFILFIVWFSAGFYCGEVAHQKGYSGTSWAIGGFFFGFIALIAAAGLPDKKLNRYIRRIGEKQGAFSENEFKFNEIAKTGENENNFLVPIKYDSEEIWSFLLSNTNNKLDEADRVNSQINKNKIVFKSVDNKIIARAIKIFSNSAKFDKWIIQYNY